MKDNARKYNVCIDNSMSYGIGASGTSTICSVLSSFTVNTTIDEVALEVLCTNLLNNCSTNPYDPSDGGALPIGFENLTDSLPNIGDVVTCSYSQISKEQLSYLSNLEYEKRISDYLKYIGVESPEERNKLIESGSIYNPLYNNLCKLNPNFLVYKFFDGVRIINVGKATGILEYKAYPYGDDPENHSWGTNPTILSLNFNSIYVFEVRDIDGGEEICRVTKTIPLNTLVQSTKMIISDIQVYLSDIVNTRYDDTLFRCGELFIDPGLRFGEKVDVCFQIAAEASGDGISCAEIYCDGGSGTPELICAVSGDGISPLNGNLVMCSNDIVKYKLETVNAYPGDCSCTYFNITGVNGLSTTNPSIDVGRCSVCLSDEIQSVDVVLSLENDVTTPSETSGEIIATPLIPDGRYVDIDVFTSAYVTLDGTAQIRLSCYDGDGGTWADVITTTHLNSQPNLETVRMCGGDKLCYQLNATATAPGASADASFEIINAVGSTGVGVSIDSVANYTQTLLNIAPTIATVSVCNQTFENDGACQRSTGFIYVTPPLINTQNVLIDICSLVLRMDVVESTSCTEIFCKPAGSSNFTSLLTFDAVNYTTSTNPQTGAIIYRAGDELCYNIYAEAYCEGTVAQSDIVLDSVSGFNGVCAYLNETLTKQYDEVYGLIPDPYGGPSPIGLRNLS